MGRPFSGVRRLYLPGLTILILLIPLLLYFFHVSAQMQYFTNRNLRLLGVMGDQLKAKINNFGGVLIKAAAEAAKTRKGKDFSIEEFIRASVPDLTYAGTVETETATAKCDAGDVESSISVRREGNISSLEFACACERHRYRARSNLSALMVPFIRKGVFEDVLVAEADGQVIYQRPESTLRIARVDALVTDKSAEKPGTDKWEALKASGNVLDVLVAGTSYKLFLQPVPLSLKLEDSPETETVEWIIGGLVGTGDFVRDSMAISYKTIAWFAFLVLVIFFSWPFLKVRFMSPHERLRATDGLFLALSTATAICLLTLLSLNTYYDYLLTEQTDRNLEQFAAKINENLKAEVAEIHDQLSVFTKRLRGSNERQTDILREARGLFDHRNDAYPYVDVVFWVDARGKQIRKWGAKSQVTPFIKVDTRSYFTNVRDGHTWALRDKHFQLQPIYSYTTGENTAVLFMKTEEDGGIWGAGMTARLLSLIQPLVAPDFGYSVIDNHGKVLFHSDETQNLRENFFEDLDNNETLRSAVFGRAGRSFSANYLGRGHRLYVTPIRGIENLPWSLVVFRNKTPRRSLDLEVLALTLFLLILCGGAFVVSVSLAHFLPPKQSLDWIWPSRKSAGDYRHLLSVYLVIAALSLLWTFTSNPPQILCWAVLTPVYAVVLCFVRLRQSSAVRNWKTRAVTATVILLPVALAALALQLSDSFQSETLLLCFGLTAAGCSVFPTKVRRFFDTARFPNCRAAYLWTTVLLLAVVGTLPCLALFKICYDHEMELLVKRGQLILARAAEDRAQRIAKYYQDIKVWEKEKFLARRLALEGALDNYSHPFFGTALATTEAEVPQSEASDRGGVLRADSRGLKAMLSVMRRPYDQVAIEAGGSAHEGPPDGWWKWQPEETDRLHLLYKYRYGDQKALEVSSQLPRVGIPRNLLGWGVVLLLFIAPFPFIRFIARKLFLLDVEQPAGLKKTNLNPAEPITKNLLVLGDPGSGKSEQLRKRSDVHTINVAAVAIEGGWKKALADADRSPGKVIALDHFEYKMDDPACSREKLHLLEELLYARKRTVVIVSAVDPLFYFTTGGSGSGSRQQTEPLSWPEVDRLAGVLSSFMKLNFTDPAGADFATAITEFRKRASPEGGGQATADRLEELFRNEYGATARLQAIGKESVDTIPEGAHYTPEQLMIDIRNRADAYYRAVWATCSKDEKLVLIHLAQDGLVSPKSRAPLDQLSRKGLITWEPRLRIVNESFKRFVITAYHPEEVARWEEEGSRVGWGPVRTAFLTLVVSLTVFLFITQREAFKTSIAFVTGLTILIPALLKILGLLHRGQPAAPMGD